MKIIKIADKEIPLEDISAFKENYGFVDSEIILKSGEVIKCSLQECHDAAEQSKVANGE